MAAKHYNKIIDLLKKAKVKVKPMKSSKFKEASRLTNRAAPKTKKMLQSILLDTNFDSPKHIINYASNASKEFDMLSNKDKYSALTRTLYNLPKKEEGTYTNSEILQALLQRVKNPIVKPKNPEHSIDKMLGKIPDKRDDSQKILEEYVENLLNANPVPKNSTEYLADDEASRSNLLKALQYNKRKGSLRALDTAIFRKEHEPNTRTFTLQELKSKYFPAHIKRGRKFNLREEQMSRYLDKFFDDFENYRESSEFKKFKGDTTPTLTEKEYNAVVNSIPESMKYHKIPKRTKEFEDLLQSRKKFVVKYDENNRPYYPYAEEEALLEKALEDAGIPHTTYEKVPTRLIEDKVNRKEMQKYLRKPQKLKKSEEVYDGFTFEDFYDFLDEE